MRFLESLRNKVVGAYAGYLAGANDLRITSIMAEEAQIKEQTGMATDPVKDTITKSLESVFAELEMAFDNIGYRGVGEYGRWNFSRATIRRLVALSRVMYLINPLIKRAVTVQQLYVWSRGVQIKGDNPQVNEVLQDFFKNPKNQRIIGRSFKDRERDQRVDGNVFYVFFRNKLTGTARIRLLPFDQIQDIICNPEDCEEPWYYARYPQSYIDSSTGLDVDSSTGLGFVQTGDGLPEKVYYPDILYDPLVKPQFASDGSPIEWDACVYHEKTGGLTEMKFGLPELFSCLNWATGYKRILENFATIMAAYARIAMKISGLQQKKLAAKKSDLQTGVGSMKIMDSNPTQNTASWIMTSAGADITPVKTANSTTGPDEARALRSMVAAGSDTPEHFFGDSNVGNFATSETLDRPTELKMIDRQHMYVGAIDLWCQKLIEWSARAPGGKLRKAGYTVQVVPDPFNFDEATVIITPPAESVLTFRIEFPNILERDVTDRVRSVVMAATLNGNKAEGIIPDRKEVCRLLYEALGEEGADKIVNILYPQSVLQGFADPADLADDAHLTAMGKKEVGDAALITAKTKPVGSAPASKSPAAGAHN